MGYGNKSLNDWCDDALSIARSKGFTEASPGEDIALMHSELSEALEDIRSGKPLDFVWYEDKDGFLHETMHPRMNGSFDLDHPRKPCGVPSEMADVIIRVLHFCGKHGIDIEKAVREKMVYNESRPFMHGGKKL